MQASINLTQADGSTLQLKESAQTIITLAPHLTELAFEVGAGKQIIATVEYSEFPPAAKAIPLIGDAFRLDLERIVTLKPDLVIAWGSGNPKAAVARLEALGISVWSVEIRHPEEIITTLRQFGLATGKQEAAESAATKAQAKLDKLKEEYSGMTAVTYFYQVASGPLYTLNGDHIISQSLSLCGGLNIFHNESIIAPQVSHESIIAANPLVMFAAASEPDDDPLARWREWPTLKAVKNESLYLLPADQIVRATSRLLDAIALACNLLNENRTRSQHE